MPSAEEVRRLAREVERAANRGIDEAVAWLASEEGRRFRSYAARALTLAAPLILRHPFFRTPVGRVIQVAGGAALVAKAADLIRDWDPAPSRTPA
jgi:hypothetical protein